MYLWKRLCLKEPLVEWYGKFPDTKIFSFKTYQKYFFITINKVDENTFLVYFK
jgi:hypothetical protein